MVQLAHSTHSSRRTKSAGLEQTSLTLRTFILLHNITLILQLIVQIYSHRNVEMCYTVWNMYQSFTLGIPIIFYDHLDATSMLIIPLLISIMPLYSNASMNVGDYRNARILTISPITVSYFG